MADPLVPTNPAADSPRSASPDALGHALEACRGYLLLIAQRELDPSLRAKGGASDLVQQTLLEAHQALPRFRGETHDALLAWMRRLLLNNLANFRRDFRCAKRRVSREVALTINDAHADCGRGVRPTASSPSAVLMRDEEMQALEAALNRLPEDYRRVFHLRYREEHSFEAIAVLMERSPNAVRKLWARALERLQQELKTPP